MTTARYADETTSRRRQAWSRRRKVGTAVIAVVMTGAIAATAAMLLRAPIQGTSTVVEPIALAFTGEPAVTDTSGHETSCDVSRDGDGLALSVTGEPGASCTISANVAAKNGDGESFAVQSIDYNAATNIGFTSGSCGKLVAAGNGSESVTFVLSIPEDAVKGETPTSSDAGVLAVPEPDYVAADCPSAA